MTRFMRLAALAALGWLLVAVTRPVWLSAGITPARGAIAQTRIPAERKTDIALPKTTIAPAVPLERLPNSDGNGPVAPQPGAHGLASPGSALARLGSLQLAFPVVALSKRFGGGADLWFRPEPTRNRWLVATSMQNRALMFTLDYHRSLTGTLDRAGWHLMVSTSILREAGEPSLGASPFRLDSVRSALGHRWWSSDLQISILGGVSRITLDPDSMALTGRAERMGAFASIQLWQEWPEGGPLGLRFGQLYLEADQARASLGIVSRLGFPLGYGMATIGPEILFSAGERWRIAHHTYRHPFRHVRIGAHLGGVTLNNVTLSVSAGGVFSAGEGPRAYAALGLSLSY